MMKLYLILALLLQALLLASCGDSDKGKTTGGSSEETKGIAITDKTVAGVSQKGPFVKGSAVHIYELTFSDLAQTGNSFTGKIASDKGDFKVKVARLASQFALLEADGYYRNEVTGELSTSPITLNAITNLSDRDNVNINLLTHLEYERVMNLVEKGSRLSKAKNLAEEEIFNSFYIEDSFENFEDLNIFNSGDGDAALLAISVLLQGSRTEAQLSELLAEYALDIEEDGSWDDELTKTKIADWAEQRTFSDRFAGIRLNVAQWGFGDVPNFEKYTTGYWWHNYGLGDCTNKRQNEVMKNQNSLSANVNVYYTCKNEQWFKASNLEKDTYQWDDGKEGDVKNGTINTKNVYVFDGEKWREGTIIDSLMFKNEGVACAEKKNTENGKVAVPGDTSEIKIENLYYVCSERGRWNIAPDIYNDTYELRDSCKALDSAVIFKGLVNKTFEYLCENNVIRSKNFKENVFGFCSLANEVFFEVDKNEYFICQNNEWKEISEIVYKNGECTAEKENTIAEGSHYICQNNEWKEIYENGECTSNKEYLEVIVQGAKYICLNSKWSRFNYLTGPKELNLNPNIHYDSITDLRDGKVYKTVKIGEQIWMAENLNYADSLETPSLKGSTWCYTREDVEYCNTLGRFYSQTVAQNVCPDKWHLPTEEEFNELITFVGGEKVGVKLKSSSFADGDHKSQRGTNDFGFSAIPTGYRANDGSFGYPSDDTYFWSVNGIAMSLFDAVSDVYMREVDKRKAVSIRCIKNSE